eukprot:CAMPEP_0116872036 /NCGR_PEP_ID=MMETSP0463-20121206/2662_1 /TAXON_ID=181622 /ORGANISM="Strombidinopsis sp, Strain SopsisLIS2011" /LENGTH=37 /DNA_ID= /DNA_START= /DNA_END= /DNA_ORIENTATION=
MILALNIVYMVALMSLNSKILWNMIVPTIEYMNNIMK